MILRDGRGDRRVWAWAMACAVVMSACALPAWAEGPAAPKYTWQKTGTSVALTNGGRVVWSHHHDKAVCKPHMKVCLVDGTELTRPWPMPAGYKGYDHPWHKAMWWSWKFIDGKNFWEGTPRGTEPVKVRVTTGKDHTARIEMDIHYRLPKAEPVLTEKRVVAVSAPDAAGRYHIDWCGAFTSPARDKPVKLNKNWYGGMAARMAKRTSRWTFRNSEGGEGEKGCSRKPARWVDFSGDLPDGRGKAGMAILVHGDNPRPSPPWCIIQGMPYFNPVFIGAEDYTIPAGKTLTLRYRMIVHPGLMTREQLDAAWKAFAKPAIPKARR